MRRETMVEMSRDVSEKADVVSRLASCVSRLVPCVLALVIAPTAVFAAEEEALPWEDARRFVEALEKIRAAYVEPVDDATLFKHAIRGMAAGLDPYSAYLEPAEHDQLRIDALGRYEGIGVEVSPVDDGYVVIAPLHGGPAQRAGLQPGDHLLRADGVPLDPADPVALDALLQGPVGSELTLTVQRGDEPPFDVTLKRELIRIPSVTGERLPDGVAYVRIAQFSDGTERELARVLTRLDIADDPPPGLILDLRNNAGGVVDAAIRVADDFLAAGEIVSTQGRLANVGDAYTATAGEFAPDVPVLVLVNQGTASAAEILAGALKDNGRAQLLGARTFGKGAMQTLIPLEDGGALKLTTAYYRTPSGRIIEHAGIVPDVEVPAANSEPPVAPKEDAVVARARALLLTSGREAPE